MRSRFLAVLSIVGLFFILTLDTGQASQDISPQQGEYHDPLQSKTVDSLGAYRLHRDPHTGRAFFLTTSAGSPLAGVLRQELLTIAASPPVAPCSSPVIMGAHPWGPAGMQEPAGPGVLAHWQTGDLVRL